MKILLISLGFKREPKEATGITLILYAKFLESKGHDVTIISDGPKRSKLKIGRITVYLFNSSGIFPKVKAHVLGYLSSAVSLKGGYDIIHSFSASPLLAFRGFFFKLRSPKAKVFHTLKSYSTEKENRFKFISLLNMCTRVTIPTYVMKEKIVDAGASEDRLEVVRSPISTQRFRPRDRVALKKKYGFTGKKIVLYYGSTLKNKGVHVLVEAIPNIVDGVKDAHFILAPRCDGPNIRIYKEDIKDMEMDSHCTFKEGKIPIEEYVAMADVVALPYLDLYGTEGNPSCLLEAAASKTPVVTTEIPEIKEIMQPGKDIMMVRPGDSDSFAKGIIEVLNNSNLSKSLSENAFRKSKKFDIKKIGAEFLKLYR